MKNTQNTGMIRLLVIEDNATLVMAGLRNFFRPERDHIHACESASSAEEAVRLTGHDRFDVILLDLIIPGHTPGDVVTLLKTHFPGKPVVIYTSIDSDLWRKRMFSLGVHGYVHKNDSRDILKRVITDAFEGKVTLFTDAAYRPEPDPLTTGLIDNTLTVTEKEMLRMLIDGLRYKQIGKALNMNEVTVETSVKRIRKRFGATSTPQLIHLLTEQGIL